MAAVAFDTYKFVKKLTDAGVSTQQAEAEAEVLTEAFQINLKDFATKADLRETEVALRTDIEKIEASLRTEIEKLELRVGNRFAQVEGKLRLQQWMLGLIVAGIASLIAKAFF